nr:MAG TPA: hypothetical protein [Caudoviricetes sp.]
MTGRRIKRVLNRLSPHSQTTTTPHNNKVRNFRKSPSLKPVV